MNLTILGRRGRAWALGLALCGCHGTSVLGYDNDEDGGTPDGSLNNPVDASLPGIDLAECDGGQSHELPSGDYAIRAVYSVDDRCGAGITEGGLLGRRILVDQDIKRRLVGIRDPSSAVPWGEGSLRCDQGLLRYGPVAQTRQGQPTCSYALTRQAQVTVITNGQARVLLRDEQTLRQGCGSGDCTVTIDVLLQR